MDVGPEVLLQCELLTCGWAGDVMVDEGYEELLCHSAILAHAAVRWSSVDEGDSHRFLDHGYAQQRTCCLTWGHRLGQVGS